MTRHFSYADRFRWRYGITLEERDELYAHQGGRCAICKIPISLNRGDGPYANVDHDHETEVVRGLLCSRCNIGLGYFEGNPIFISQIQSYLKK